MSAPPAPTPTPYDSFEEEADDWQQPPDKPMQAPWSGDLYAMGAPRATSRTRRTVSTITRLTVNTTMFGLVLLILAIAISIGLRQVQSWQARSGQTAQPTPTIAPTAVPVNGFAGLQASLYSVSYPSQWSHNQTGDVLGCGCGLTGDVFSDGGNTRFVIYTRPAAPADQLAPVLIQAAGTVGQQQAPQALLLDQQRTYGGGHWIESDYIVVKVIGAKQVQIQVRVLIVNFNATTYIIVASDPRSDFSHANSAYFEPMLQSFRFD